MHIPLWLFILISLLIAMVAAAFGFMLCVYIIPVLLLTVSKRGE